MAPLLEFRGVSKVYALRETRGRLATRIIRNLLRPGSRRTLRHTALHPLDLSLAAGQSLAVIGANGSGKTTLLRLAAGITDPTSGTITRRGRIASLIDLAAGIHPDLSGLDNIRLQATLLGLTRAELDAQLPAILEFAELGDFIHTAVGQYSLGMMLRLTFATAVHTQPNLLIVDEALAVGDAYFQWKCLRRIRAMQEEGCALLFVTHVSGVAEAYCREALWLEQGRVRSRGPVAEVMRDYRDEVSRHALANASIVAAHQVSAFTQSMRIGNGRARITEVRLLGADGSEPASYPSGSPLVLCVDAELPEPLPGVSFTFTLGGLSDGIAVVPSSERVGPWQLAPGRYRFTATIESLDLPEGLYIVSLSLNNPAHFDENYDGFIKLFSFHVTEPPGTRYSERLLRLSPTVRVEPAPGAAA